jgi:predicted metal-dependent peptidase
MSVAETTIDSTLLQAARLWIGHHRPYYASALYRCSIVPARGIPTMAVDDHWRIYVNPEFANALGVTRFAAALVHEVNHLIRDHAGRARLCGVQSSEQRHRWNLAGDAELNDDLVADGLDVDKARWVFPWTFGLKKDLTAEVYYQQLKQQELGGDGCGSGSGGVAFDDELPSDDPRFPAVSEREAQMVRTDVAEAVLEFQRARGDLPGDLVAWAQGILHPKVDWRRVLAGLVREAVATVSDDGDFTYRRFGRRSSALPQIRVPGLLRHVPQVAVIIDTSGSMGMEDLERAVSEVQGILRSSSVADDAITLLTVDARVHGVQQINRVDEVRLGGRGGTDMTVGITAALALKPRPDIIVVLTDGYTPWPDRQLRVPLIAGLIHTGYRLPTHARPPAWIRSVDIDTT